MLLLIITKGTITNSAFELASDIQNIAIQSAIQYESELN